MSVTTTGKMTPTGAQGGGARQKDEVWDLKQSLTGHKGHLMRMIKAAEKTIEFVQINPTPLGVAQLKRWLQDMDRLYNTLSEGYKKLSNLDPKNYKEYEGKNEEVLKVWLKWSRELIESIDAHDAMD